MATKVVKKRATPKTKKARKKTTIASSSVKNKQRETNFNNILAPNFCELVEVKFERNPPDDPEASEFENSFGVTYQITDFEDELELVVFNTIFNVVRRLAEEPDSDPSGEIVANYITIAEKSRATKNDQSEWLHSEIEIIVRTLIWPKFVSLFSQVTSQTTVGWPRLPLTIETVHAVQQENE